MKFSLTLFCAIFIYCSLLAQQFGGNPSSIHWKQVNTDTVRVIFPSGMEMQAGRLTSVIHNLQKSHATTIGNKIRKISIVLHDETLFSNAYVGLAPYRSEFYLTPPQNPFELGSVSWIDNLAVHEFRHVEQYSNFNRGISKLASVLFGQEGQAVANAASVPDWFFEGDAVWNETRLSRQGRGTLPLFLSHYRVLAEAGKKYSYSKLRNGSLRQYVPNHYDLGYLLVTYGREKYGAAIWKNISSDAASFKPLLYPFQGAVKKHTGIPFKQFVNEAMQYYQKQWELPVNQKMEWVSSVNDKSLVNYQYPYAEADGSVLVLKKSNRELPAFYRIRPDKSEEKIAVRDISADDYFSFNQHYIIYAAYQPDARWGFRDFTNLTLLDIKTGKSRKLVTHSKFLSPDISHNGKQILAVTTDAKGGSKLFQLDEQGEVQDSISRERMVFSHPKFASDDRHWYVAARNPAGEMALLKFAANGNHTPDTLLPFSNRIIGFLQVQGDTLSFTTTYEGRDESWAFVDARDRKGPFRLASFTTGIYQTAILPGGKIWGSAFTADGYRLAAFTPLWERVEVKNELKVLSWDSLGKQKDRSFLENETSHYFPVSPYSRSFQLLNIHSYRPYYDPPEYSFTLYGQNVLNTLQSQYAYTWNQNEGSHKLSLQGVFGGWYLQPVLGASQTWQRTRVLNIDTTVHWNEQKAYAGLQLPLNLTDGKHFRYLTFSALFNTQQVKWTGLGSKFLKDIKFNYLNTRITYSTQVQQAIQHIFPHWAQSISIQYRSILGNQTAHQLLTSGSVYLPGLGTNHSLVLTAAFQSRDTLQQYLFSNDFPFSRGYTAIDFPQMWKVGMNYHFPLAYPDWGFAGIVYFQRVRANLFYDYTRGKSLRTGTIYPFHTMGSELFFDTKWWNQQPISFGIRYSRLLDNEFRGVTQPNIWEFILPVNLFK